MRFANGLLQDARNAVRLVLRQPGFAAIVCLTLAIGIGATTALFSVLYGVLLRPLPYPDADRIVTLWEHDTGLGWTHNAFTSSDLRDYQIQNTTLEAMGGFFFGSVTLIHQQEPELVRAMLLTHDVMDVMGVQSILGRTFAPEDDTPGAEPTVIISHGLWQQRFGGDSSVIGRAIPVNDGQATIIGIMPQGFRTLWARAQILQPLRLAENEDGSRSTNHFIGGVARTRDDAGIAEAKADLNTIAARLEQTYPETNTGKRVTVEPLKETIVGDVRQTILLMMAGAGVVLLIICANLANLFLSRNIARRREIAVRAALGARRGRLLQHLTVESLLLTFIGGVLGWLLAGFGIDVLLALEPGQLPRTEGIELGGVVMVAAIAVAMLTGLLFGGASVTLLSGKGLADSLKSGKRISTAGPLPRQLRRGLVVAQMALATVLITAAMLLTRSMQRLLQVDPGFRTENVLMGDVGLWGHRYQDDAVLLGFESELRAELERSPDVLRAATVSSPPLSGGPQIWTWIEGREPTDNQPPVSNRIYASPEYFRLLGLSVIEGRAFDERDRLDAPLVVVVNEAMARRHWPDESPIGKRFRLGLRDYLPLEIVGVVSDIRQYGLPYRPFPAAYLPVTQHPIPYFNVLVQTRDEPLMAAGVLRRAVRSLDPNLPVASITTLDQTLRGNIADRRFSMLLVNIFALVALVIAAVGVYGMLAYFVSQRVHEIGIRLALGADPRQVVGMVVRHGMILAGIAIALGLPVAYAVAKWMQGMLFEIAAIDPITFAAVPAMVLLTAFAACGVPALRAARANPVESLRVD